MTWRDNLLPASFRGAAFEVESREYQGGRRKIVHEFPGRDAPYSEDQGRRARQYRVEAYCIGEDYQDARDALLDACENYGTPGTLVLPWGVNIQASCDSVSYVEKRTEGGFVVFSLTFIEEAGAAPAPVAAADTSATALDSVDAAFAAVSEAFGTAFSVVNEGLYTVSHAIAMGEDLVARVAGLATVPLAYLGGVSTALAGLSGQVSVALVDAAGFAGTIGRAIQAYGDGVVAYEAGLQAGAVPAYNSAALALQRDPTGGLAALAADFAADYAVLPPATTSDRVAEGVNQQALTDLVNAAVALAVAQLVAQGGFDSADAAADARDRLIALFDSPIQRAADTGADTLYSALRDARAAALADVTARGASLPTLVRYRTGSPLNALSLAWRLYPGWPTLTTAAPDTAKAWAIFDDVANDLIVRNRTSHPAFMPVSGQALAG